MATVKVGKKIFPRSLLFARAQEFVRKMG